MRMTIEEKETRKAARKADREAMKTSARIDKERNQPHIKSLTITIEWKKSRTWGNNPHAEVQVEYKEPIAPYGGTFERRNGYTASGCGYDKESTVIAEIFNDFLKYKLYQTNLSTEPKYYRNGEKHATPYGVTIRPDYKYFAGGIGTSCYTAISEYIGGTFEHVASGKTFDVYKYTDNEEAIS